MIESISKEHKENPKGQENREKLKGRWEVKHRKAYNSKALSKTILSILSAIYLNFRLFFLPPPPPPTSLKHEFYGLTSGFTRLIMATKYVCHGLISLHANFYDNRTK